MPRVSGYVKPIKNLGDYKESMKGVDIYKKEVEGLRNRDAKIGASNAKARLQRQKKAKKMLSQMA